MVKTLRVERVYKMMRLSLVALLITLTLLVLIGYVLQPTNSPLMLTVLQDHPITVTFMLAAFCLCLAMIMIATFHVMSMVFWIQKARNTRESIVSKHARAKRAYPNDRRMSDRRHKQA